METFKQSFGRRLRQARKKAGYSAERLAEKVDVQPNTIYSLERAESWIGADLLDRLGKALNVEHWVFFSDIPPHSHTLDSLLDIIRAQEQRINLIPDDLWPVFEGIAPKSWEIIRGFAQGLIEGQGLKNAQNPAQEFGQVFHHKPK